MKTFLQYVSTEATERKWGRKSPNMTLRKESNWIPHIQMKPKRDPWQQKQMAKLKELRSMDELLQMHSKFLEESDLHKVTDALKQYIASVCQQEPTKPSSISTATLKEASDIWRSIYNTANMFQVATGQTSHLSKYTDQKNSEKKNEGIAGQSSGAYLLEKDEDAEDGAKDPVTVRGAYASLIYLRHLRIRELKRTCLSMLNYLRSVERTLVMDTAGLELVGGDLVRSMEETGWMNAARGDDGSNGALGSHHYIFNSPVDYKVHCAEFMEFPEVENLHDYYSTDGSCIHTQDQRGLYIIYDVALMDLEELEQHLLLTASHFIQRSRAYRDTIVCLQSHQQLIKLVLNNQIDEQRQYLERIWREGQNGCPGEYGLPPKYIPKHLVSVGGSRLYKSVARLIGFDEVHLYLRPVQFEFAVRKEIPKQLPVFITALEDDKQNADRFVPNSLPLAVQELDESHIGKFNFQSNEGVLQLMNQSSLENLQVVLVCQVVQKNALIGALKQTSLCYITEKLDQSSDTDLLQHGGTTSSQTRKHALATRNRLAGAFVSVQLEKVCLRDEMLNTFIKKKEQMSALKLNSEEVGRIKRKLILEFCHKFNKHMSQHCVRGQIVALCHSLCSLLDEVPHIRDNYFVMGTPNESRSDLQSDDRLCPDPRTFQPRPRRLFSADGKRLVNLWFIPHYTEVLLMFRALEEKECHQALQNTLQIISALHDVVYYLVSFARLGNPNTSFSPSSTQRLTADWGGLESIGAELWDVQRQIDSLCEPRSSEAVARLLQLHRDVLFLRFDTAVRYMIREAFLSSGNLSAYQSVSENMSHALPIMNDSMMGAASFLSVPEPLEPACLQAQKWYPWRSFIAVHGLHPLTIWDVSPIEHYMQLCLCDLNDRCRMEANGAILGVSLIIDDVLSSGRDAAPLQLQTTGDPDITTTSDRELLRLLEITECDMIRALQKRINSETTLVMSERSRHDARLPAELWKRPSMKHSVSLERPQIVEDFIQRLGKGVEREIDGQDVKELEAKEMQASDPYRKVADVCRGMMVDITALRARVSQLEEEKKSLEQHLNLKHRERYDTLVRQLFSSCLLLKSRLDKYHVNMDHGVRQLVSRVRKEGVDRIIKLKNKLSSANDNETLIHTLHEKEVLEDLHAENSKLAGLVCKLRAFNHWRLVIAQEKLQKELLQWKLNEVSCKTEALKVKMISEQKEIGLKQELDAVQEAMLQYKSEYKHIQRQIIQQQLEVLRMQSLEQLQEDMEDRQSQLRALSAQLEKNSKETELRQQHSHKQIKHVRGKLHQERSLKLEAFQQVDKLQSQIHGFESALCKSTLPSGRQSSSSRRLYLRNASAGLLRNNSVMSFTNSFINTTDELSTEMGWRETWTPLDRPKTNSNRLRLDISEALLPSLPDGNASSNHLTYQNLRLGHK
ncbi:hypothetical protein cypCar_00011985 [Cyprinus carpio]|nr:hypothetical protein cypCar_00011985 [Cyprinus carpio]